MARPDPRRSSTSGLFPWVLALGGLSLATWYFFHRSPEVAPGRVDLSRLSPRRVQTTVSLNGIAGAAAAGQREIAAAEKSAPPEDLLAIRVSACTAYCLGPVATVSVARDDPTHPPPAIRISGVTSGPFLTREEAVADALRQARDQLGAVFAALGSPIREVPSEEDIKRDYLEVDSVNKVPLSADDKRALEAEGLKEDRTRVRLSVSLSEEQLRQLRARQRLHDLSRWAVAALAVLVVAYGVLRADDRSQGYFTWLWAAIGAALIGGVVTLALVL